VKTSARQGRGHGDDERGVKPARDENLPRRSVEILRDLGLSKEKIVAYGLTYRSQRETTYDRALRRSFKL
jgi:hypothetical protein